MHMENSIFGSSEILQCIPCVHTYIRPSAINGSNNILTKFSPTEHEYITMHGLLVTLKNLFVRTEHDYSLRSQIFVFLEIFNK